MNEQETTEPAAMPTGAADALHDLALRLLTRHDADAPEQAETALLVGRIPEDLPVEIPLPDGSRIAGSLVRGQQEITIVLDSALPPEAIYNFYGERLPAASWRQPEFPGHLHGGFVHVGSTPPAVYCHDARRLSLTVNAYPLRVHEADVHLRLSSDPQYSPCAPRRRHHDIFARIPPLAPPQNARQQSQGGSGGGDSMHTTALLETDLDLAAVAAHYQAQLAAAGWIRGETGASEPLAWSVWTFRDEDAEEWHGIFFALGQPWATGTYALEVRAEWSGARKARVSSWVTSTSARR